MAATGVALKKTYSDTPVTREQAVIRQLAELCAKSEWALVEMGRTLHDDVGQVLTAAGIQFAMLADDIETEAPQLKETADQVTELLTESQARVRAVTKDLNRSTVERIGLKSGLERSRDRWEEGFRGFVSLECPTKVETSAGAMRSIVRMAEYAFEIAVNREECSAVKIAVKATISMVRAEITLDGIADLFRSVEDEVRWNIFRAFCHLAGGETEIVLAFQRGNATILRASFSSRTKGQRRK